MKKVSFILAGLVLLGLVYSYGIANGAKNDFPKGISSEDYIIIRYDPFSSTKIFKSYVFVYYGGGKTEPLQLTKEQKDAGVANFVIDLLNKYNDQGYTLISTTSITIPSEDGAPNVTEITCFLKKSK